MKVPTQKIVVEEISGGARVRYLKALPPGKQPGGI